MVILQILKNKEMRVILISVFVFLMYPLFAQDAKPGNDALVALFPDAMGIWAERKSEIKFSWDKGKIKVAKEEMEEMLFPKDESSNYAGSNRVYYSSFYNLKNWEAYTLLPDGKKVKVSNSSTHSSQSSFVFYDDSKEIEFLYPAITKGARGITKSEYEVTDAHLLSPFYFDSYFPVANGALTISYPEEIELNYIIKGQHKEKVTVKKETKKGRTVLTLQATNIPGANFYADAPPAPYFLTHVVFFIEKVKDENGVMQPYLGTQKDLAKYYYSHIKHLETEAGPEVKQVTDSVIRGKTDAVEKAKAIYKFVQQSVRYIAFEEGMGGFVPRNAELVCNRRYGDCKDKSSLLVSMLRHAGLKAHFTWIGSRQLPYDYTEVPLPVTDDHMICALDLNGKFVFMDATDSYIPFNIPASHIQGKQAFILMNENHFVIERVPVPDENYSLFADTSFITLQNKMVKGKIKIHTTGYQTNELMHYLEARTGKAREEYLQSYCQRGNNKVSIKNIQFRIDTLQSTAQITADFDLPDYVKYLGNEIYINMNINKPYVSQEIDYPKRKVSVESDYKLTMRHVVVLQIPDNYKLATAPEVKSYDNDVWGVSISSAQKGNELFYVREFKNKHLYLQPDSFEKWNKVLEHLFPTYKQSFVLDR
jgi:transglutaminase-like putative cysteine protease